MRSWLFYIFVFAASYCYNVFNMIQVSERQFFTDFAENTTRLELYNDHTANIFLNNNTSADHFIRFGNDTGFEKRLDAYPFEVLHKVAYFQNVLQSFWIIALFAMLRYSGRLIGISRSIYTEDKVKTRLKDVAGLEHQKQEIFEFVDFLKNREKYIAAGARMPRGALFHGPPGTGKTLLAKAVAGECGVSFLSVAGPDFSEMFVGVGAARVRDLFKKAREKAPCIVFIDEIDALARSRTTRTGMGHHEKENTLNRFLVELDGFQENDKVLIFGATNRLDMLDKALLRPGRFDRKIRFELPERKDREEIFSLYLNKIKLEGDIDKMASHLSKQSLGFSCADIANICNEASILSIRQQKDAVTQEILEAAVDNVILGHEKKTFRLSDEEREIVALHESGHTLIAHLLPNVSPPIKVSIMPRGKSALGFSQCEVSETKLKTKEELLERICVLLGGRVAEEFFCDSITTGASDDVEKLTTLAYRYVGNFAMDSKFGAFHYDRGQGIYGNTLREEVDTKVQDIIHGCHIRVKHMIKDNKGLVRKMADVLLERETLLQDEIVTLFTEA